MGEHRVPVLSASLRRHIDPERSADPRIRRVVAGLRTLEPGPAPRAHFRAELRAQLVAVTPRLVAEGVHTDPSAGRGAATTASEPRTRTLAGRLGTAPARLRSLSLGRPIAIVTAIVAVFALLLGGAVWVSKKALPGDSLYALKRANENVQLSLTNGDTARGKQYLSFAATRADEVAALLHRSSATAAGYGPAATGGVNSHTATLVESTLGSADSDVRNAAQLLGGKAVRDQSAGPLGVMTRWAPGQLSKLQSITSRLPAGDLHDRAAASAELVGAALARAQELQAEIGCSCLGSASTDELGPVPCPVCTVPAPQQPAPGSSAPSTSTPTAPSTTTTPQTTGPATAKNNTGGASGPSIPTIPGVTGGSTGPVVGIPSIPGLPLPSVTVPLPTLPPKQSSPSTRPPPPSPTPTPPISPTCILSVLGVCVSL